MTPTAHVSAVGTLLGLAFGGSFGWLMMWMFRTPRPAAGGARTPRPPGMAHVILVPVTGSGDSQRAVEMGCRLAEEQHAGILLVYVIEVPWTLPLDATLERAEAEARQALEAVGDIAAPYHVPVRKVIRRARNTGDGIVQAARDYQVDLVLAEPASRRPGRRRAAAR